MIIGIPKEIKDNENRVAVIPPVVQSLTKAGHEVFVQNDAGKGSGYENELYEKSGAKILDKAADIFSKSEMIIKVKEPQEEEYDLIKPEHIVFTYFHFASSKKLTQAMVNSKATCLAYETVTDAQGGLPLLLPMSMIAGRLAVLEGAKYLLKPSGGQGVLIGGIPGGEPAKTLIIGGGASGTEAAKMAAGLGSNVYITDINLNRLKQLSEILPANVTPIYSSPENILKHALDADLIVGAVLIPGAEAPKVITKSMVEQMKKGAVLVDIAIDQGGCFETSKPTTHSHPVYIENDVIHYAVTNMPGAVPKTATNALSNATSKYILAIANKGVEKALKEDKGLQGALNIANGKIIHESIQ